jgi:hypothetical protein
MSPGETLVFATDPRWLGNERAEHMRPCALQTASRSIASLSEHGLVVSGTR